MPHKVSRALDALGEPGLTAVAVATSLDTYLRAAAMPRSVLSAPFSDWAEHIAPIERQVLQDAMDALPARHAELLRRVVERADEQLVAKTLHHPGAVDDRGWWWSRWVP